MVISSSVRKLFAIFTAFVLCLGVAMALLFIPRSVTAQTYDYYYLLGGGGGGGGAGDAGGAGGAGGGAVDTSDIDAGVGDVSVGNDGGSGGGPNASGLNGGNGGAIGAGDQPGEGGNGNIAGGGGGGGGGLAIRDTDVYGTEAAPGITAGGNNGTDAILDKPGVGGNGGSANIEIPSNITINNEMRVQGGDGGNDGFPGVGGKGGDGGDVTIRHNGELKIGGSLNVISGSNGTDGIGGIGGKGGGVSFSAQTLIAPNIYLRKKGGDFSFSVTDLKIEDLDTNLIKVGTSESEVKIDNLLLNGNGKFSMGGTGEAIKIGRLVIDGGTLHDTPVSGNWNSFINPETMHYSFFDNTITLGSGGVTINLSGDQSLDRTLTGLGGLIKDGAGALTLNGVNNYIGGTTLLQGRLNLGNNNALGDNMLEMTAGTTLGFSTNGLIVDNEIRLLAGVNSNTIDTGTNSATLSGRIFGAGSLTKSGTGTLILSVASEYTGGTILQMGAISIGHNTALGTGTLSMSNGTTLGFSASGLIAGNHIILNGSSAFNTGVNNATLSGNITGFGMLTKIGDGTLTLTGSNNNYLGNTTVNAGTLRAGANGAFANNRNYTVNGGTLDLNNFNLTMYELSGMGGEVALGSATLTVSQAGSTVYNGVISGTGSLVKSGAGTLTLTGDNLYTGTTTVSGGVLQAGANNAFTIGAYIVNNGKLDLNGNPLTMTSLSGTGGEIALGSAVLTLDQAGNTTYAGTISEHGFLTKSGDGTMILTGNNTYTGSTTVNNGTLRSGAANAFVNRAYIVNGGTLDLNGNSLTMTSLSGTGGVVALGSADLTVNQSESQTEIDIYSGVISGSGSLTQNGTGTLTLTGDNRYTGNTAVIDGTLQIGDGGTSGGILGNIANNANVVFNRSDEITHNGDISGSGNLALIGSGMVNIAGEVTQENVDIVNGALTLTDDHLLKASDTLHVYSDAQLGIHVNTATPLIEAGKVVFDPGAILNVDGYAGEGTKTVIKTGTGIQQGDLDKVTMYVAGAALPVPGLDRFLNVDAKVVNDTGLVDPAGHNLGIDFSLVWKQGSNNQDTDAHGTFNIFSGNFTLSDSLTNNVSAGIDNKWNWNGRDLTKKGAGTLILSGDNAYTGMTTVEAGTLRAGSKNAFVNNSAYAVNGGILDLNGYALKMSSLSGTGGEVALGAAALTVSSGNFGGFISGSGSLTKEGAGTLTLGGINTYTGRTTVEAGTLKADVLGAFVRGDYIVNGGTLDLNSHALTMTALSGTGGQITLGRAALTVDQTDNTTYEGAISGDGSLIKDGAGRLTLIGANTYKGDTRVNAGILYGNITNDTNLTVRSSATYDSGELYDNDGILIKRSVNGLFGDCENINTDCGGGNLINRKELTVQHGNFGGNISGDGALIKNGDGTLVLRGANTYKGDTTVNAGILRGNIADNTNLTIAHDAIFENLNTVSTVTALNGGGRFVNNSGLVVQRGEFAGDIDGNGFLTKNGTGTLTLTGNNTYKGDTTINAGTLIGNIAANTNLTVARDAIYDGKGAARFINALKGDGDIISDVGLTVQSGEFGGIISGDGSLTKTGTGMLTLSGANTYAGLTEIRGGTLRLNGGRISDTLSMYGGTTLDAGITGAAVNLRQLDVRGSSNWQGDFNMVGQTMNFYLPTTMGANGRMLTVGGTANITDSTVNVDIAGESSPLKTGDTITLISANILQGSTVNTMGDGKGMQGVSLKYEFALTTENNRLLATVTTPVLDERAKALSEGYLGGGLILSNQGANLIDWKGVTEAVSAAWRTPGVPGSGSGIFSALSAGTSSYETGSKVDMSSFSVLAGLAWGEYYNPARMTFGPFFEYGTGSYDTFNSFTDSFDETVNVIGSGKAHYVGGGILGRVDFADAGRSGNSYMEGSFRAGITNNEYVNSSMRDRQDRIAEFDSSSVYFGLHVGTGYAWNTGSSSLLDMYGKLFWTRQQGDSVSLTTGDPVDFNNSNSSRFRAGGRWSYAVNETFGSYVGAAYEYEFSGEMKASTNGFKIDAPSLRGGSFIWEGGATIKPSTTSPLFFDLGARGYTGKNDGVFGSLRAGIDTGPTVSDFWSNLYMKFRARFEF